jgi:hypothetical protein
MAVPANVNKLLHARSSGKIPSMSMGSSSLASMTGGGDTTFKKRGRRKKGGGASNLATMTHIKNVKEPKIPGAR